MQSALETALKPVLNRIRQRFWATHLLQCLMVLAGAFLAVMVFSLLFPLVYRVRTAAYAATIAGAAWFVAGFFRRPGLQHAIRAADSLGLRERVVTAFEFIDHTERIYVAQREDALCALLAVRPAEAIPLCLSRRTIALALSLIMLSAVLMVIPYRYQRQVDRLLAVRDESQKQAEHIKQARERLEQANKVSVLSKDQILRELKQLEARLRDARSPEQALKALGEADSKVSEIAKNLPDSQQLEQALAGMARALGGNNQTRAAGARLQQRDWAGASQELQKAAKSLDELGPQDRRALSDALFEAAGAAQASGAAGAKVAAKASRAARALASGDTSVAAGEMDDLADDVADAGEQAELSTASGQAQSAIAAARYGMLSASAQTGQNPGGSTASGNSGSASSGQQGSGQGSGQSSSGQGGASGSGARGISRSPGQTGTGTSGAGAGSTNQASGSGSQAPGTTRGSGTGTAPGGQGLYERIYAPQRLGGDSEGSLAGGRQGQGPSETIDTGPLATGRSAHRPYSEVFRQFERQAAESLERQEVPPSMRDYVRRYFSSLEPSGGR